MGILDVINDARQPGGLAALGQRAINTGLGNLPGVGNFFTNTTVVDQNLENIYGYFLSTLLQSGNSVSLKPLWVCFLDTIPDTTLIAEQFDQNYQAGSHVLALGHTAATSNVDLRGAKGALLAQEVNIPGDNYTATRGSVEMGGHLNGVVGTMREGLPFAKIAYLETTYSFADFVLRPWMISASYQSLKLCPKTNITMINFAKSGADKQFAPRKIITLHNAVPVQIDSEPYTYDDINLTVRQIEWHYDSYTMKSGQLITEGDLLASLDRVFNVDPRDLSKLGGVDSFEDFANLTPVRSAATAAAGIFSNVVTNTVGRLGETLEEAAGITPESGDNTVTSSGSINSQDVVNASNVEANRSIRTSDSVISQQVESAAAPRSSIVDGGPVGDDVLINKDDTPVFNNVEPVQGDQRIPSLNDVVDRQIKAARGTKVPDVNDNPNDDIISGGFVSPKADDVVINIEDTAVTSSSETNDVNVSPVGSLLSDVVDRQVISARNTKAPGIPSNPSDDIVSAGSISPRADDVVVSREDNRLVRNNAIADDFVVKSDDRSVRNDAVIKSGSRVDETVSSLTDVVDRQIKAARDTSADRPSVEDDVSIRSDSREINNPVVADDVSISSDSRGTSNSVVGDDVTPKADNIPSNITTVRDDVVISPDDVA